MEVALKHIDPKKLAGLRMTMSLSDNKTAILWRELMINLKEIRGRIGNDLYSLQVYNASYFTDFDPSNEFEKWALTEVANTSTFPASMSIFHLEGGLYAVFIHKGGPATGAKTFQYIFNEWLPASGYTIDNRPHFEILGDKYKNDSPDSEEEIWIPVKLKQ